MSLIICTECGKQISEYAESCPNCGCPIDIIKNQNIELINNLPEEITCPICGITRSKNLFISNNYKCDICEFDIRSKKEDIKNQEIEKLNRIKINQNRPKCPTCQSTKIRKISATRRAVGALGFGLLSKTAKSQFECTNCGYKW